MKRSGFTLIEMSIVLIIIGLIIGGVMKGKDLINGADQKKIYNTWVKQWQVVANEYQDRTGGVLDDATANGGSETDEDGAADGDDLSSTTTVQDKLKAVGLDVPVGNIPSTKGGSYRMKGKYITSNAIAKLDVNGSINMLKISGVPTDIAIAFDKMSDGSLNPQGGDFIEDGSDTSWPDASSGGTVDVMLKLQ